MSNTTEATMIQTRDIVGSYMPDTIDVNTGDDRIGAFFGSIASRYAYIQELRVFIDHLIDVAQHSTNRHFVIKGTKVLAAQTHRLDALDYMSADRVLVSVDVLPIKIIEIKA